MSFAKSATAFQNNTNIHNFRPLYNYFVQGEPNFHWRNNVSQRLNELCALDTNWDGYGAQPVNYTNARFVEYMLVAIYNTEFPTPFIAPGVDGDLQVEWHIDGWEIELHCVSPRKVNTTFYNPNSKEGIEIELDSNFNIVVKWMTLILNAICDNDISITA